MWMFRPVRSVRRLATAGLPAVLLVTAITGCGSGSSSTTSNSSSSSGTGSSTSAGGSQGSTGVSHNCSANVLFEASTTGPEAIGGQAGWAAIKLAAASINKAGGADGCQVKVALANDQTDVSKTVPVLVSATSRAHYDALVAQSSGAIAAAGYTTSKKLIDLAAVSLPPGSATKYPYLFATAADYGTAPGLAVEIAYKRGYRKVALITDNTTVGGSVVAGVQAAVKRNAGMKLVSVQQLPYTAVNTTSAITASRAAGADVLINDLYGAAGAEVQKDLGASGWKVPELAGYLAANSNYPALAPRSTWANLQTVTATAFTYPATPAAQRLISALKASGYDITQSLAGSASAYDALLTWAWAANEAKSLDPDKVKSALESTGSSVPGTLEWTAIPWSSSNRVATFTWSLAQVGPYVNGQLKRVQVLTK